MDFAQGHPGIAVTAEPLSDVATSSFPNVDNVFGCANIALVSPVEAVKDSTLMSVISLGVFEHVSNFESWVRHVKGAAALVIARGKSQFSSPTAILMPTPACQAGIC
ncbi:hypothetical protein N7522_009445 [Penicillium canescens]|nr:hypothetical protein N7522_009445 [Penicillium canescens]